MLYRARTRRGLLAHPCPWPLTDFRPIQEYAPHPGQELQAFQAWHGSNAGAGVADAGLDWLVWLELADKR